MLIVGERINTFKKRVMRAYEEKDVEYIRGEALRQAETKFGLSGFARPEGWSRII